jgi:hypothetical protein
VIRPLRKRHDALIGIIGLLLVTTFAFGLVARVSAEPAVSGVPDSLRDGADGVSARVTGLPPVVGRPTSPVRLPLDVGDLVATRGGGAGAYLDLDIGELPPTPGLLLYWSPSAMAPRTTLPTDAVLLGALRPRTLASYPLPPEALSGTGSLMLYSLGHQQTVGEPLPLDASSLGADPLPTGAGR